MFTVAKAHSPSEVGKVVPSTRAHARGYVIFINFGAGDSRERGVCKLRKVSDLRRERAAGGSGGIVHQRSWVR
jgi:hypothetical protein